MSTQPDAHALVQRVFDHVEAGDVDEAVFACLRLARTVVDPFNAVMFLRETGADKHDLGRELLSVTEKTAKFIWERTFEEWTEERRVLPNDPSNDKISVSGIGGLMREVAELRHRIDDLRLPSGMGEFDTAAFTDQHTTQKLGLRSGIEQRNGIIERIRVRCLSYASRIETQLRAQERASSLVANLQNDVDNYFAARCPSAHAKLVKASELAGSTSAEDHSLLLTSIRRAVKAVADHLYPATKDPVVCVDGKERTLGDDRYLSRLQEFCARLDGGSSTKLVRAELDYLAVVVRRLNDVASKGVHAEVTRIEARQGLLTLYTFLSNLISKIQ